MREQFHDLYDLLGYYQYLKLQMTSMPTILPKPDFGKGTQTYRAKQQQSRVEEHYAFIGTVERFATWYYKNQKYLRPVPEEALLKIFHLRFCKHVSKFQSWGQLAIHFKKRIRKGEPLPKRLQSRGHLHDISSDMEPVCDKYFIDNGLIRCSKEGNDFFTNNH